jgi:hypothetical protein
VQRFSAPGWRNRAAVKTCVDFAGGTTCVALSNGVGAECFEGAGVCSKFARFSQGDRRIRAEPHPARFAIHPVAEEPRTLGRWIGVEVQPAAVTDNALALGQLAQP